MPKLTFSIIACFLARSALAGEPMVVSPESVTSVDLSNRDVNRIVCEDGDINDNFFSEEKGAIVSNQGKNSFIKFRQKHDGLHKPEYISARNEFYVVCAGQVYTLMVAPKNIAGQTVRLSGGRSGEIYQNLELLGPLAEEDRAVQLTMRVMKDDIPEGFTVKPASFAAASWRGGVLPQAEVQKVREVRVDGIGLTLHEYLLRATSETSFSEVDVLQPYFGDSIFAVSIFPLSLRQGQVARLFVVSKEVDQQ